MQPAQLPQAPEPFQSLIQEWARSLRAENKSPRTIRTYTDAARWLHIWLADPVAPPDVDDPAAWLAALDASPDEPDDVRKNHVRGFLAYRVATTSPSNANNNYRALLVWFQWLVDEEEMASHPMARLKPPYVPELPGRRVAYRGVETVR